jgi:pimeloyl-ACP methyl ester carboxylesterase
MRHTPEKAVRVSARIAIMAVLAATAMPAAAEEIVTLPTREGVTQSFLLTVPAENKPAAAAILFAGTWGAIKLHREAGEIKFESGNFLVRSRQLFIDGGIATAVVDTPSDQPQGMEDWFRLGDKHARDIAAVIAELKKRFDNAPVFLVGTSRGTLSAASGGRASGNAVAGVILTATMFLAARSGQGLSGFDFTTIVAPLLFVHHIDDGCAYTRYRDAKSLAAQFPLITVRGGDAARSDPCEAYSAHGFLGKEPETVAAMVNWMLKKPYRSNID